VRKSKTTRVGGSACPLSGPIRPGSPQHELLRSVAKGIAGRLRPEGIAPTPIENGGAVTRRDAIDEKETRNPDGH
jgi:hypothetical protein